jgi:hypothetical protein
MTPSYTSIVYFPDVRTAQQFAQALRRRGQWAARKGHKVYVALKPYEVSRVLWDWSKNRGSIPWTSIVS